MEDGYSFHQLLFFLVVFCLGFLCSCLIFLLQRVTPSHSTLIPSGTSSNGQADTAVNGRADTAVIAPQLNHLSRARPPLVFAGDSATFREWVFTVEMAMKVQGMQKASDMVNFAAMHLSGNACLFFINAQDAGQVFPDWPSFKSALGDVFGPLQEQEQARLRVMTIRQESSLEEYIRLFSLLSLQLPDVDEHTKALMFVRGLKDDVRTYALTQHPKDLSVAIRAVRTSSLTIEPAFTSVARRVKETDILYGRNGAWPRRLTNEDKERLKKEGRCFACRQAGHRASDCAKRNPNGGR